MTSTSARAAQGGVLHVSIVYNLASKAYFPIWTYKYILEPEQELHHLGRLLFHEYARRGDHAF